MRKLILITISIFAAFAAFPQVTIQMKRESGVSIVPCKVNGLNLKFIFDTGAGDVSISMTEATFMLKNDYLSADDIVGKANYLDANGNISVGVRIILREVEIGGLKLYNVKASVVNNMKAPLLLGQSAISKLGVVQLDLNANTLTILNTKGDTTVPVEELVDSTVVDSTSLTANEPDEYEQLFKEAKDYYEEGKYQEAITDLDLILNEKPFFSEALFIRAVCHDMLQDYKSAIADYNKVITLDSKDHVAICYRGKSKYDLQDYSGALSDLNKGLLINDRYILGIRWRAETKMKLKNLAGALLDYNKAILLSPQDSSLYIDRAFLKDDLKDYTGAIIDCNKALSINSDYARAYYCRGVMKRRLKQYTNAIEDLNRAIDLEPDLSDAYEERGSIKEAFYEDYDGALEDYNKALELNPQNIFASIEKSLLEDKIKKMVWIWVGTSSKGDKWYIYNAPISKDYSTIKLWIKFEAKSLTFYKNGKQVTYVNGSSLNLCLFNCAEQEYKILSVKDYDSKGNMVNGYDNEEYEPWKAIVPGTMIEAVLKKVCERYNN